VVVGTQYHWGTTPGRINSYRVELVAGNHYTTYFTSNYDTDPVTTQLDDFDATVDGWTTKNINPVFVNENLKFRIFMLIREPADSPATWYGDWNYTVPNNQGTPGNGVVIHSNAEKDLLYINYIGNEGTPVDHTIDLQALAIGDIIDTGTNRYGIQSKDTTNPGYIIFAITPTTQGTAGQTTFKFETTVATNITYAVDTAYWPTIPAYAASVSGLYKQDEQALAIDTNAYGVDINVQELSISESWDFLAGEQNTSGDSAATATWGLVQGDIKQQDDAQAEWVNKTVSTREKMIGELQLPDAILAEMDEILNGNSVVDVFIYDTSLDDDGGAWVDKANYQSWFTELGQFPKLCIIVVEANRVILYDGKDGSEWMVFESGTNNYILSGNMTSVTAKNGTVVCSRLYSLNVFSFINDSVSYSNSVDLRDWNSAGLDKRNAGLDWGGVKSSTWFQSAPIVNSAGVHDVACTSDGNMNNTVAVATNSGVSVIHPDGSVADITFQPTSNLANLVSFYNGNIYFVMDNNNTNNRYIHVQTIPYSDRAELVQSYARGDNDIAFYRHEAQAYVDLNIVDTIRALAGSAFGSANGLNQVIGLTDMIAYTTADYCSGYMHGDIKGAWLASTDDTDLTVGQTDPDRSVNNIPLNTVGTITKEPVAAGAELVAYSGFAAGNYLERPHDGLLDFGTGDFYVMGWVKFPSTANKTFIERAQAGSSNHKFGLNLTSSKFAMNTRETVGINTVISDSDAPLDVWNFICGYRKDSVLNLAVNGNSSGVPVADTVDLDTPTGLFRVGLSASDTLPATGTEEVLVRTGKGAPTAQQVKEIYDAERPLFQPDAKCTLQGTNSDVKALDYDESTGLLTVCSANHTTKLNGLVVASDEALVATSVSTTSNKEVYGT